MPSYRTRTVAEVVSARQGLQRVQLDDSSRAFVLTALVGEVEVGDEVVVNTTAVDLGLGTGGWHVVHWNLSRRELDLPGRGHVMKLRYTSLQADTGAAEEDQPAGAADGDAAHAEVVLPSLGGVPVLVGGLHSQVAIAAVAVKSIDPSLRVVYVMTDGAALPLALSDLVADLCDRGLLDATVTAGHAFGGDLRPSASPRRSTSPWLASAPTWSSWRWDPARWAPPARSARRRSRWRRSPTWSAPSAARPLVMARASEADRRPRHRGVSHHTRTALALCRTPCAVPLPADCGRRRTGRRHPRAAPGRARRGARPCRPARRSGRQS